MTTFISNEKLTDRVILISSFIYGLVLIAPLLIIDGINRVAFPSPDLNAHLWYLQQVASSLGNFNNVPIVDSYGYLIGHNFPLFYLINGLLLNGLTFLGLESNQSLQLIIFFSNLLLISIIFYNIFKTTKLVLNTRSQQYLSYFSIVLAYEISSNLWRWLPDIWAFAMCSIVIRYTIEILKIGISKKRLLKILIFYGLSFSFKLSTITCILPSFLVILYKYKGWFLENFSKIWKLLLIPIFINSYTFFTQIGWNRIFNPDLRMKYVGLYKLNNQELFDFLFTFQLSSFSGKIPIRPNYGSMVSITDKFGQSLFIFSDNKFGLIFGSVIFIIFQLVLVKFFMSKNQSKYTKYFFLGILTFVISTFTFYSMYLPVGMPSRMRYNLWFICAYFFAIGLSIEKEKRVNKRILSSLLFVYNLICLHTSYIYMQKLFDYDLNKFLFKVTNLLN